MVSLFSFCSVISSRNGIPLSFCIVSFLFGLLSLNLTRRMTSVDARQATEIELPPKGQSKKIPMVINTWKFTNSTSTAYQILINNQTESQTDSSLLNLVSSSSSSSGNRRLDAIEKGCSMCEINQCDGSVGYGGDPDTNGEVTLDAMIMDGPTHDVGAVGYLRNIRSAISVARAVLDHTSHTLLVGEGATEFAVQMGFAKQSLETDKSDNQHDNWLKNSCQPNYYTNFNGQEVEKCPPYDLSNMTTISHNGRYNDYGMEEKKKSNSTNHQIKKKVFQNEDLRKKDEKPISLSNRYSRDVSVSNHDTIGMIVIDANGDLACGTSTNGLGHKVAGRVGDSPIPGSGCYVDNKVGGAAGTGDGCVMMRFTLSAMAVQYMKIGHTPQEACEMAVSEIINYFPSATAGLVCVNKEGDYGAAAINWSLSYAVQNGESDDVQTFSVDPLPMPPSRDV